MEETFFAVVFGLFFALVLFFSIRAYNGLVRLRALCEEGWDGVLRTVRRRRTIVSRLLEAGGTGELDARMRKAWTQDIGRCSVRELREAELGLSAELSAFWERDECASLSEAERSGVRHDLSALGAETEMARAYYNATARDYNTRLRQFPSNLIGWAFRFGPAEYLELD